MGDNTLRGTKMQIYILLKIIRFLTQRKPKNSNSRKISSYTLKFAVDEVLKNRVPEEAEWGAAIRAVLHHPTLRGRFDSVSPALAAEGICRVEVGDRGLSFVRGTLPGEAGRGGTNIM
jgi:hypothetical protein